MNNQRSMEANFIVTGESKKGEIISLFTKRSQRPSFFLGKVIWDGKMDALINIEGPEV